MKFIKKRKEYLSVYAEKNKVESYAFLAFYHKSEQFRVGIAVTKKVGKAVVRNKVKRRIKSFLYSNTIGSFPFSIVIIAKPVAADIEWNVFSKNLYQIFSRIKSVA